MAAAADADAEEDDEEDDEEEEEEVRQEMPQRRWKFSEIVRNFHQISCTAVGG